jgi:NADH-quinone oxidoreductase subunit I
MAKGFLTTSKHAFRKPVTVQYPETKLDSLPRFKGRHILKRYEDGLERCIGCSLCAAVCPADAIYVGAAENTDEERYSPGERYAEQYEINMIRCIFCGMCEEVCPTEAIVLGHEYELSGYKREDFIYTKERLLEPLPVVQPPGVKSAGPPGSSGDAGSSNED